MLSDPSHTEVVVASLCIHSDKYSGCVYSFSACVTSVSNTIYYRSLSIIIPYNIASRRGAHLQREKWGNGLRTKYTHHMCHLLEAAGFDRTAV